MSLLFPLPDAPADVVRAELADFLATPAANPRVVVIPMRDALVQDQLDRQHAKQERRRFLQTPEPVTDFSELEPT